MSSTLFTAAIILGAVFIFIILFILLHKKGHNKKLAKQKMVFADIIWKNKLEISEKETINHYLLAIDKINFVLLYINFNEPKEEVVLIDLWHIRTVKVTIEDDNIYEQRKGKSILMDKHLSKLQLEVTLVDAQLKANLALYEYKGGIQNFVHIKRRADYWCHLINKGIQELPHPSKQKVTKVQLLELTILPLLFGNSVFCSLFVLILVDLSTLLKSTHFRIIQIKLIKDILPL